MPQNNQQQKGGIPWFAWVLVFGAFAVGLLVHSDVPVSALIDEFGKECSKFVVVDGVSIHYCDQEPETHAKDTILLIHGTASSLHTWDGWTDVLLENSYRVIRLDLPGFGLTGPSKNPRYDYSVPTVTKTVYHFLEKIGASATPLVVGGNSLGGEFSWRLAVEYPSVVSKLILVDANGPYPRPNGLPFIFKLGGVPVVGNILKYVSPRWMIKKNVEDVYFNDSLVTDALVTRYHNLVLREGNRAALLMRIKNRQGEEHFGALRKQLQNLNVPTLILWGEHDTWTPVHFAPLFAEDIKGSKLVMLENLSHVPMEEAPEKTAGITIEWLEA